MTDGIIITDSDRAKQLGFTSEAFTEDSYLWKTGDTITISFIESRAKGNFKKLVESILAKGWTVVVPTPSWRMRQICRENGYVHSVVCYEYMDGEVELWTLKPK